MKTKNQKKLFTIADSSSNDAIYLQDLQGSMRNVHTPSANCICESKKEAEGYAKALGDWAFVVELDENLNEI